MILPEPLQEGNGTPLQYSCLENPMDGGAWWGTVHGVTKSQTRLSDFTCTFHFPALEKEMATHSSVLAWRIPGTGEPGGLPSHRVGHDWGDLAAAAAAGRKKSIQHKWLLLWEGTACVSRTDEAHDEGPKESEKCIEQKSGRVPSKLCQGASFPSSVLTLA